MSPPLQGDILTLRFQINWADVTAVVAVYGAVLSTWNAVSKHLESSRRIKVDVGQGFGVYGASLGPASLVVTARNVGKVSSTLVHGGLLLPDNRQLYLPQPVGDAQLPLELSAGKSCRLLFECKDLAGAVADKGYSGTIKLVGFYRDAVDKTYKSKSIEFDIGRWLRHKD